FGDLVRGATLKAAPQVEVMTRENLLVLLQASGKDLANCEGECEVDTGRRIGADAIVSGEVLKVGTRFKLTLRLHETRAGMQLGTEHDADALQVKLDVAAGLVDFTFSYKLLRAGRLVEEGSFVGNDQPCWAALSTKSSKMECVIRVYADRILGSRVLALE